MPRKFKILVIEDDDGIRESLFETLGSLGFAVGEASSGEEGLERLRMVDYDVTLLDINMPGIGGRETLWRITRDHPAVPVIVLTVRNSTEDITEMLDAGASDYVTKPFRITELTARLRATIRRRQMRGNEPSRVKRVGTITLDVDKRRVTKNGNEVHLTPREYDTLEQLMSRTGVPVRHDQLLSSIWGPAYRNEREYLRVVINQLRKKLEENPMEPQYILTESHVGYRFRNE